MPQINSGKSPPWVSGEIVTAAGLNGMIDAATLDPSAVTAQSDFPTLTGDEYALIVDPVSGQLKKTQLKNSLLAGNAIETNYITGHNAGNTTLSLVAGSDFYLSCGALGGLTNTGIEITGTGVPVKIKSVFASGGSASAGGLIFESAGYGMDFSSTNNGTVRFAQRTLFNTTGAIKLPVGTTAQRPATPVAGDTRFNSTTSKLEFYNGTSWTLCVDNATGSISTGMLLYDVYEENIPYVSSNGNGLVYWYSSVVTKPAGEIWIVEIDLFYQTAGYGYLYIYNAGLSTQYKQLLIQGQGSASALVGKITDRFVIGNATTITSEAFALYRGAVGSSGSTNVQIANTGSASGDNKLRIYKYKQA